MIARRWTSRGLYTGAAILVAGVVWALANAIAYPLVQDRLIVRAQEASLTTLGLVSDAVDQAIDRFKPIPGLIATDPIYVALLNDPDNQGLAPFINEKLRHLAETLEVSEIYVIDRDGTTLAASNYREAESFVGNNFAYRPYVQRALAGETVQFHALGTTSGARGFFFSAPILDGIEVRGVLAVKITVDAFERAWAGVRGDVLVADPNGVVFLSSRPAYRLRALAPLSEGALEQIVAARQYPLEVLRPIPFSASVLVDTAVEVVVEDTAGAPLSHLASSQPLTLPGWHSIVLVPLRAIRQQALYAAGVGNLGAAVLALGALLVAQARARTQERIRIEQSQRDMLERMVQARTADLDAANANLRLEVAERRATEERLRRTQKDLIQAGKLAALGQMSAALSHEINQPLAALKSFAENATQYLARGRTTEAGANLARISQMADRMAKISGHLRNFARRPGNTLKPIPLSEVVDEAIALMGPQLKQSGCAVHFDRPKAEVWAIGGPLRLQQVIINIMTNALDAMAETRDKRIDIALDAQPDTLRLCVRDTGPGLSEAALEHAFDAFFTTKEAGIGMGLGLSISFNIIEDFGGKLALANHPDGGGLFTLTLRRAKGEGGHG